MTLHQQKFVSFAFEQGALQFGEFVLNSGRTSPYFINTGSFSRGAGLSTLASFYAATITQNISVDFMLYGPAYKGIPLAASTAVALHREHGLSVPYAFNRKEAKDHGDQGWIVGSPLRGQVVIVEDVVTSGISINTAVDIIRRQGAEPVAVVICLDRMERAVDSRVSAVELLRQTHGIDVFAIATVCDLLEYVKSTDNLQHHAASMKSYMDKFVAN